MSSPASGEPCYLVEWYRRESIEESLDVTVTKLDKGAASMCAEGSPVQLVAMLAVPTDEVVFGVFSSGSPHFVAQACRRAGLPADRLSPADAARIEGMDLIPGRHRSTAGVPAADDACGPRRGRSPRGSDKP